MDNPSRWNITNSAQHIVSALVDPTKQYDHVFRREWTTTFAGFTHQAPAARTSQDSQLKSRLNEYIKKLNERSHIREIESKQESIRHVQTASRHIQNIPVPDVFLMEDFDLSKIEIFNKVITLVNDTKTTNPNSRHDQNLTGSDEEALVYIGDRFRTQKALTIDQLKELQQDFTDYLDVIEEKLASQISNRSGDFFQVMSSVDSVMDELSLAIRSVTTLRRKCSVLNNTLVTPHIKTVRLNRSRQRAQLLLDRTTQISELCKVQPMIQLLLSSSDYVGALDMITRSRQVLQEDLANVTCLKHLEPQFIEIEKYIGKMMQQEFVTLAHKFHSSTNLSKLVENFANGMRLNDRRSKSILTLLQTQGEIFVNKFHEERLRRVGSTLDIEQWKMVDDIPSDIQRWMMLLFDNVMSISDMFAAEKAYEDELRKTRGHDMSDTNSLDSSNHDSPVVARKIISINGRPSTPPSSRPISSQGSNTSLSSINSLTNVPLANASNSRPSLKISHLDGNRTDAASSKGRMSYLTIGGEVSETFALVNSVINMIRVMMDYCRCAQEITSLGSDVLDRLFTILHLYNSKTYHLVYSAGAIQVAGLKTITTRSLILSQRSLKLITLLLPVIRRHFSQLLPDNNDTSDRLSKFDDLRISYEDHAAKIPERINTIVRDVINLQLQEWEAKPPVPSMQFTAVAQHLMRLHDNVQDVLPPDELRNLFVRIHHTFKEVLTGHLRRLNIGYDAGPRQWLATQELTFYKVALGKLSILKGYELGYDDIWAKVRLIGGGTTASSNPNQ